MAGKWESGRGVGGVRGGRGRGGGGGGGGGVRSTKLENDRRKLIRNNQWVNRAKKTCILLDPSVRSGLQNNFFLFFLLIFEGVGRGEGGGGVITGTVFSVLYS